MWTSKLGFGPMSKEIIEAVFLHSAKEKCQLMLIASRNQIDWDKGYVFTTKEYAKYTDDMKSAYPGSDVKLCRDHCGSGFRSGRNDMDSLKKTIKNDIENGFELIHIDLCHLKCSREELLNKTALLIEFALSVNPSIKFEIGTEENAQAGASIDSVREDLDFFRSIGHIPQFYVTPTGSLVKGLGNVGSYMGEFVLEASNLIRNIGSKFKEHNADYLNQDDLHKRKHIIDALNIAPQLGVLQTSLTLQKALLYGVSYEPFMNLVCNNKNWKKWSIHSGPIYYLLLAGHYHFQSLEYNELVNSLSKYVDINGCIVQEIYQLINYYKEAFVENN